MSSRNPFDAQARRRSLNHAVAKFHRRLTSLAHEIDADIAEHGFGGLSSHPKIADAFRSLDIVVKEALAFEKRAAEFQRQRLRDTGEFDQAGAWTEEDGKQLWERLRQELEQLPERFYSQAKRLLRLHGKAPSFRDTAAVTAEDLSYRVSQAFAEGRARMRLAVQKLPAATEPSEGEGGASNEDEIGAIEKDTPPLDRNSGNWVSNKRAADIEGIGARTLADYRSLGIKNAAGNLGRDTYGRVWRREGTPRAHPWYLRSTLLAK